VLIVGKSDLSGTQVFIGGPQTANHGFGFHITGNAMKFQVNNGVTVDFSCPAPVANNFFAYIAERKSGTSYCFKSGTAAPTSAGTDSTTLGSYNLKLGSEQDGTLHYLRGTIGEVAIWNRALCSTDGTAALACPAGTVGEVQREFGVVHKESASRGWGL